MKNQVIVKVALVFIALLLVLIALQLFLRRRGKFDYVQVWGDMFIAAAMDSTAAWAPCLVLFDQRDGAVWGYSLDALDGKRAPVPLGKLTKLGAPIQDGAMSSWLTVRFLKRQEDRAARAAAKAQIAVMGMALEQFYIDTGRYPGTEEGLELLVQKPGDPDVAADWDGPYLREIRKDPWGHDYIYLSPGATGADFDIICYGKDGIEGGEVFNSDITNHNLDEK
jgi:general secretion pathway protein G